MSLIYRSTVLSRPGWTAPALKRFAGEPDQFVKNKHYRSGPPAALYESARIEQIERTPDFVEWRKTADERKARAKAAAPKAVATRRENLLEYARSVEITIPQLGIGELRRSAIDHYNARLREDDFEKWINSKLPLASDFEHRITVNFLRHQESQYEQALTATYGKTGVIEAYAIIRRRVLDAIRAAYPQLNSECGRQQTKSLA